ncbi:MAG: (d)CMP kinase [Chromatiales bacterium]|nr:MAG: (d)CMP kinase [Chromatiales bacterium]
MSQAVDECGVLTIDGPSGSGKGTVARRVADALGWRLLDSGALYRLTALAAMRDGVRLDDIAGVSAIAAGLDAKFDVADDGDERILLRGEDVTAAIRNENCGELASQVAQHDEVRKALVGLQKSYRKPPGLVADGRDMGTVIFPDAGSKVFLTASPEERARRRYKQLKEKGISANLARLSIDISERDKRDATRAIAPLRPAADAVQIDTTGLSIDEVVALVVELVRDRLSQPQL